MVSFATSVLSSGAEFMPSKIDLGVIFRSPSYFPDDGQRHDLPTSRFHMLDKTDGRRTIGLVQIVVELGTRLGWLRSRMFLRRPWFHESEWEMPPLSSSGCRTQERMRSGNCRNSSQLRLGIHQLSTRSCWTRALCASPRGRPAALSICRKNWLRRRTVKMI